MSGRAIAWAMEQVTGSAAAKLILVKLADNANEEGLCWPSVKLIVRHCELGESTVREKLKEMEAAGLIHIRARMGKRGQTSNYYHLNFSGAEKHQVISALQQVEGVQQVEGAPYSRRSPPPPAGEGPPSSRWTPYI